MEQGRTQKQNNALHLFFEMLAEELNNAGLDMRVVIKPEVDIPWSKESVKEYLWRPIQKAQLNKKSTTSLTKSEVDEVYAVLMRHLSEKFGLFVNFPAKLTEGGVSSGGAAGIGSCLDKGASTPPMNREVE